MSTYTAEELTEARRSIDSTLHKCEKALLKLTPGKSQHTLTVRRIKAFQIALSLIDRELEAENEALRQQAEKREAIPDAPLRPGSTP